MSVKNITVDHDNEGRRVDNFLFSNFKNMLFLIFYILIMKVKFSFLIFFLFFSCYTYSQNWNLIWNDEFNGSELDTTKWIHEIGTGSQYGLYGWGNSELQYYQPQD